MNTTPAVALTAVAVDDFLHTYLAFAKPATIKQIANYRKNYADPAAIKQGLERLIEKGYATLDTKGKVCLSDAGREALNARYGGKIDKHRAEKQIWPALALGIDPCSKTAQRLATKPDNLRAVMLVVLYQLPLDPAKVTLNQAVTVLMVRGLAGVVRLGEVSDAVKTAVDKLEDISEADALRRNLIKLALLMGESTATQAALTVSVDAPMAASASMPGPQPAEDELTAFAKRVQTLTNQLETPPIHDSVAVAQVYDAYGRQFPDAGRLDAFKQRLLAAHRARLIMMRTLDMPDALPTELRERSTIEGQRGWRFHLILRGSYA